MLLLILDTETNSSELPDVIEIGCVAYDSHYGVNQVLSTTIPFKKENEFLELNRISKELSQSTVNHNQILKTIRGLILKADYCIAYNAEFDKPLIETLLEVKPQWICAMKDFNIPHPKAMPSLVELALHYNVPICKAHRAINDCFLLASLFDNLYNFRTLLKDAIARSKSPKITLVGKQPFKDNHLAKVKGFHFNYEDKQWQKVVAEMDYNELVKTLDFPYQRL